MLRDPWGIPGPQMTGSLVVFEPPGGYSGPTTILIIASDNATIFGPCPLALSYGKLIKATASGTMAVQNYKVSGSISEIYRITSLHLFSQCLELNVLSGSPNETPLIIVRSPWNTEYKTTLRRMLLVLLALTPGTLC